MHYEKLAVSTITFARSEQEESLIERALTALSLKSIAPIIVVDGGSNRRFIERIKDIEGTTLLEKFEGTLQDQVKESLMRAKEDGFPYIFYTESNKESFFRNNLDEFVGSAMEFANIEEDFGMALASRTRESFATFPPFQQYEEGVTNQLITRFIDTEGEHDYAYGPRIISASLVPYLDKITGDVGWGWMSFIAIIAKRIGRSVHSVLLDLPCPEEERNESETVRFFRLSQLKDHVAAITQAARLHLE